MTTQQKVNTRNTVLIVMVVFAALLRLFTYKFQYLSNFTPVGAIAMFGGIYFDKKWKAYAVVLLTLWASDVIINHGYTGKWSLWSIYTFWNVICFSLTVFIGSLIKKVNLANSLLIILTPVLIHWLLMDIPGVTVLGYPVTIAGYIQSLTLALPFEKNMLLGDIAYGILLFGGFEFAKSRYTFLRTKAELAVA